MLGRIMPLEALGDPPGFIGWEGPIERCWHMGIQIVLNQNDDFGLGKMNIAEVLKHRRIVDGGAACGNFNMSPALQRREGHKQVGCAVTLVFAIEAGHPSRNHRYGLAGFGGQLFGGFIQTDKRPGGVMGALNKSAAPSTTKTERKLVTKAFIGISGWTNGRAGRSI